MTEVKGGVVEADCDVEMGRAGYLNLLMVDLGQCVVHG